VATVCPPAAFAVSLSISLCLPLRTIQPLDTAAKR
jgi:hypothetical protein